MIKLILVCMLVVAGLAAPMPTRAVDDSAVTKALGIAHDGSPSVSGQAWDSGDLTADKRYRWLQEQHRQTQLLILVGAMTAALIIILFFLRTYARHSPDNLVNGAGLVLVIFGTLYISECAITTEQLTAPMGILGAIAGYIFGSAQRKRATRSAASSGPPKEP